MLAMFGMRLVALALESRQHIAYYRELLLTLPPPSQGWQEDLQEQDSKVCSDRHWHNVSSVGVLLLLASLVVCCIKNRRAATRAQQEVNVEANQVDGPPTIIATEYHPTAGPSPVYSPRPGSPAQISGPAYPVAAHYYKGTDTLNPPEYGTRTAPVTQGAFPNQPYPFSGGVSSTSRGATVPKTAFVTGGFPRPLLAGERLKERLKERPASVSHSSYGLPPSPRSPRPN
ncbi:hypothetical protein NLJ89_g5911 [Agrocybe chaxingu]|uniref:Uncharacterized protein n=1 Tax=Agrocybe chaxingu TaxID=84603 RepID=A0A9W8JXI4_9AGAR|nr:hypothetical protein NLJ89_g5911 [Agrocybe chaxingu]